MRLRNASDWWRTARDQGKEKEERWFPSHLPFARKFTSRERRLGTRQAPDCALKRMDLLQRRHNLILLTVQHNSTELKKLAISVLVTEQPVFSHYIKTTNWSWHLYHQRQAAVHTLASRPKNPLHWQCPYGNRDRPEGWGFSSCKSLTCQGRTTRSKRVFSGYGISANCSAGFGKTYNFLTGYGIWPLPGIRDLP